MGPGIKGVLGRIVQEKQKSLASLRGTGALQEWRSRAQEAPPVRDFRGALEACPFRAVIAEIKRASPSAGLLRPDLDPVALARTYEGAGAAALSVLTEETFFQGSREDLSRAREAVSLPVLAKDFHLQPIQLYQARAAGADAVLLIAAILAPSQLGELAALAGELGLAVLMEVHGPEELPPVLALNPSLLGVNNRNLQTLQVSLRTSLELAPLIPHHILRVAESGLKDRRQIRLLHEAGYQGFLIGTGLVTAPDPGAVLAALLERESV